MSMHAWQRTDLLRLYGILLLKQKANWSFQILFCQLFTGFDEPVDVSEPCHIPRITVYSLRKKSINYWAVKLISKTIYRKSWNDSSWHRWSFKSRLYRQFLLKKSVISAVKFFTFRDHWLCLAWTHTKNIRNNTYYIYYIVYKKNKQVKIKNSIPYFYFFFPNWNNKSDHPV